MPDCEIYNVDCIPWMENYAKLHPAGVFDLIFADPPYRLSNGGVTCVNGKMVSVNKAEWDRSEGFSADYQHTRRWLQLCYALLKKDGTIWVSGTNHIINIVGAAMQEVGYRVLNDIIWEKPNPPPNLGCRCFTHSHEILLWASKGKKSQHHFEYARMKEVNGGKQMKSVWRFAAPSKSEKSFGRHPTQKPLLLLDRIISASSKPDATVFDPFAGSGTTAVAALSRGRRFVGCEIESEYVLLATKRVNELLKFV